MPRCAGNGYECCEYCANQEIEFECDACDDGDNFESLDDDCSASGYPLTFMRLKEAA